MNTLRNLIVSLSTCLAMAPAMAADYFVVVPVKGRTAPVVSVSLAEYTLPSGMVGAAYSADLAPLLQVKGDSAYTGTGVSWRTAAGALPAGLTLSSVGRIYGTPSSAQSTSFTIEASYKAAIGQQNYAINIASSDDVGQLMGSADFGSVSAGQVVTRVIQYQNTGPATSVGVYASLTTRPGITLTSSNCGTKAAPVSLASGATCNMTLSWDSTQSSSLSGVSLAMASAKNSTASVSLVGTVLGFNATGAWSSSYSTQTALTTANVTYPTLTPGFTTNIRAFYLNNTGTSGKLSFSFTLSGDTSQFQVTRVYKMSPAGGGSGCYATVSATAITTCTADDINGGPSPKLFIEVKYAPTTTGNHALVITPVSQNGASAPAPITLTGKAVFDATSVWSSSYSTPTALTAANLAYGVLTPGGATITRAFYIYNTGTHGNLAASFVLSGDTSQFQITRVYKMSAAGGGSGCYATVTPTAITTCTADDVFDGPNSRLFVEVKYAPTVLGNHTLTITPVAQNSAAVPGPITLSGSGVFDAAGAWSSSLSTLTPLTAANLTFGPLAPATSVTRQFYVTNTGTHGILANSFALSGDTSQFQVTRVYKMSLAGAGAGCYATISPTAVTTCTTDDVFGGTSPKIFFEVKYAPTVVGNHTLTVTPTSQNGAPAPSVITLTGKAQ